MPVISTFFGILIRLYYREHGAGHFHAEYQSQLATFTFDGKILAGAIRSQNALRLIEEWATPPRAIACWVCRAAASGLESPAYDPAVAARRSSRTSACRSRRHECRRGLQSPTARSMILRGHQ
ncbi:MAG: DUF4160 domain-containing protein [Chloroflexi bacterium]|nr:DUF4160 domain-containing protein [Chloroflexota bacterium]